MALTDAVRAEVFARDKGICAFSGLSLWILDGSAPPWQMDWPDHIKPVSRGGKDTPDNLVCASFFYNRKKLNNGADNAYLFKYGRPTETYFWTHGALSDEQAGRLVRHAAICESDWYFNRALTLLLVALHDEWSRLGATVVRKADYWCRAACKKLRKWRSITGRRDASTFVERGLVGFPNAPDVRLMLALADAED